MKKNIIVYFIFILYLCSFTYSATEIVNSVNSDKFNNIQGYNNSFHIWYLILIGFFMLGSIITLMMIFTRFDFKETKYILIFFMMIFLIILVYNKYGI